MSYFIAFVFCLLTFIFIVMKLFYEEELYKERMEKRWKLYIFKDGTNMLSRGMSERELKHEIAKHGQLLKIANEDDAVDEYLENTGFNQRDLQELNEIEKEKENE